MKINAADVSIRQGRESDFDAVRDLDRQLIAHDLQYDPTLDPAWSESEEAAEFFLGRLTGDGVCFVAEYEGQIIGAVLGCLTESISYRRPVAMAELETLFVSPSMRGAGGGKRLMAAFQEWAKANGAAKITIRVSATNKDAITVYERQGYAAYDLIMELDLGD